MSEDLKVGDRVKTPYGREGTLTAVRPQFGTRFEGEPTQFLAWREGCLVRCDGEDHDEWNYLRMLVRIDRPTIPTHTLCPSCGRTVHDFVSHSCESDAVNHPAHYTQGTIECIDYILDKKMDYLEGNIVKYITRYKVKNGVEDLKKARWYLDRLIQENTKKEGV